MRHRKEIFCGARPRMRHRNSVGPTANHWTRSIWAISVTHYARCATESWISVAHPGGAPQKLYFCGDVSVAHPAFLGVRHRICFWCATVSAFPTSAGRLVWFAGGIGSSIGIALWMQLCLNTLRTKPGSRLALGCCWALCCAVAARKS